MDLQSLFLPFYHWDVHLGWFECCWILSHSGGLDLDQLRWRGLLGFFVGLVAKLESDFWSGLGSKKLRLSEFLSLYPLTESTALGLDQVKLWKNSSVTASGFLLRERVSGAARVVWADAGCLSSFGVSPLCSFSLWHAFTTWRYLISLGGKALGGCAASTSQPCMLFKTLNALPGLLCDQRIHDNMGSSSLYHLSTLSVL